MTKKSFSFTDTENLDMSPFLNQMHPYLTDMKPLSTGTSPSFPDTKFPIKAVLLDIYGTLLISEAGDIGLTSLNTKDSDSALIFSNNKATEHPYSQIHSILHDLIRKNHKLQIQKDQTIRYPEIDIISIWQQLYKFIELRDYTIKDLVLTSLHFEMQTNKICLMPETAALLKKLKKAGIPTGIVSNAQFYTPLFLEYLLGDSLKSLGIENCFPPGHTALKEESRTLQYSTHPSAI